MALRECGFPSFVMATRNGSGKLVRPPPSSTYSKDNVYGEDGSEGRVVESLGHVGIENKWCVFVPTGSLPPARAKHAALSIGRRMFVLGGTSADGVLDDVQVFHAERGVWLQLGCGSVPSLYSPSKPIPVDARGPRCVGHCLAFWETKLLVIGGRIEPKSQKLKAFALDLQSQSWSILAPKGEVPAARTGQSIVQVGSALILFGGEDTKGQMLSDIFILDLKTLIWLPLKTTGSKPSPRRGHSAVCYTERFMLVFGGKAHGTYFNDIHFLDLQTMEWTKDKPKGAAPTSRAGHKGAMVGSKWFIVGGEIRGSEALDTLAFDFEAKSWSTITTVQPGTPLANDGLSIVKVRNKGRTFLLAFGGHGAILSNQIFVMLVASNRTSPPSYKREEAETDDLSTSSLPFSFTSGSLRTIQTLLNPAQQMPSLDRSSFGTGVEDRVGKPADCNLHSGCYNLEPDAAACSPKSNQPQEKYVRYPESAAANGEDEQQTIPRVGSGEETRMSEAKNFRKSLKARLHKALTSNKEVEMALKRVEMEKQESEQRLEEALSTIAGLKREVEALVESRIEGDRRLRAARTQLDKFEAKLAVQADDEQLDDEEVSTSDGGDPSTANTDLRQQLRESQQQIVLSVRKQALAERKLLGALKENRELRKKLLHARDDQADASSSSEIIIG